MMVSPMTRILIATLLAAVLAAPVNAQTWDQAHGDSMNAGYANVTTAPATGTPTLIGNHGRFAPGAGFAIASNGYFFVGNDSGGVFGFSADGSTKPFVAQLEDGEGDPAERSGLPVRGAPAPRTTCEIRTFHDDPRGLRVVYTREPPARGGTEQDAGVTSQCKDTRVRAA